MFIENPQLYHLLKYPELLFLLKRLPFQKVKIIKKLLNTNFIASLSKLLTNSNV